jgi:2-iminobutanoate/2-iminopropanoate deaminase
MRPPFQIIEGPDVLRSNLPFTTAIRAGDFVFISGMASASIDGRLMPDTFENEARRTFQNIARALQAAGLTFSHVVQARCYLANQNDWDAHNRIYREFFTAPFPARTTLIGCVGNLIKYEVEIIAYAGKETYRAET